MVDLDRRLDRRVAEIGGAEVDDVDEEEAARRDQIPEPAQRAGDVEQVIDRLAQHDDVELPAAQIDVLDQPFDRLDAERLCLRRLERRGIDDRRAQIEPPWRRRRRRRRSSRRCRAASV